MIARATLLILVLCLLPSLANAESPTATPSEVGMRADFGDDIERRVMAAIEAKKIPGAVVLVARQGKIVLKEAFGNRQIEPEVEPMTVDTLFDMASITKPVVTATSIMQLVEQGKIRLRDPVVEYLPEFKGHGKEEITVEQLMLHTGGLIPDTALSEYENGWAEAYEKMCQMKPQAAPGERFRYSDVGFQLLGEIVSRVSGQPLEEYTKQHIFEPLGMKDSGYNPPEELHSRAAPTEKQGDKWLRGVVHDPRARRTAGVAGHAGLFSTADDIAIYSQALIDAWHGSESKILSPTTVREMTRGRDATGGNQRTWGWDSKSAFSRNRGETMTASAFGHGGFTGTALWIDPELELTVLLLSNRLHPSGKGEANDLAGRIGTIAASACLGELKSEPRETVMGVDVLANSGFAELKGRKVGVIGNHTSRTKSGQSIVELLANAPEVDLVAIFSPEHGFMGVLDQSNIGDSVDPVTGLPIKSLYGKTRKPTPEQLEGIDTLVFDIQDIGCRFYTYISTMGLAMEAAAENDIRFIVLDRPNPIDGVTVEGPLMDQDKLSFVGFHPIAVRHGMTIGELALMLNAERKFGTDLKIIEMENWRRSDLLYETGLPWRNTSPNMRSLAQAVIYPGIGLVEMTNVSVGRGTDTPFELMGAPWIDGVKLAEAINAQNPPGAKVIGVEFTPNASKYEGQLCGGINIIVTDWNRFRSVDLAWATIKSLRDLYPEAWEPQRLSILLGNTKAQDQVQASATPEEIRAGYEAELKDFLRRREAFLLYE